MTETEQKTRAWLWLPAAAYLALIHWGSAQPAEALPLRIPEGLDKLAHLCEFALLAVLFWPPCRERTPAWHPVGTAAAVFAFVALNGVLDEFHQSFVAGRMATPGDAAADAVGGFLALLWMLHREKRKAAPAG